MSVIFVLSLAGLAIIDSTSIGTLFIPVWLLLTPGGIQVRRLLAYLGTITAFYFVVGMVLVAGGPRIASALEVLWTHRLLLIGQLVVGGALFVLSFWVEKRKAAATARILRWRDRAVTGAAAGPGGLTGLALLAALAEVATMLPYLGAIGLISTADLPNWSTLILVGGYCVVMILPALALYSLRTAGFARIDRILERLNTWVVTKGSGLLGWLLAIAGFLVARDAAARLWFPQLL
ncbi:GAP family protein [Pilimelia columellifera]|uniref:GAP family protein n=1 Tax=Pilimelia columellifera subsp. columellifera TaxID=706583 RepID=A0ABN3NKA0_9ACTN